MNGEPLWTRAGIVGAATAVLALLVAFGVPLDSSQQVAVLGFVAVAAPLVVAVVTRSKVTPYYGEDAP